MKIIWDFYRESISSYLYKITINSALLSGFWVFIFINPQFSWWYQARTLMVKNVGTSHDREQIQEEKNLIPNVYKIVHLISEKCRNVWLFCWNSPFIGKTSANTCTKLQQSIPMPCWFATIFPTSISKQTYCLPRIASSRGNHLHPIPSKRRIWKAFCWPLSDRAAGICFPAMPEMIAGEIPAEVECL